jgi:hypothetical protein
VRDCCCDLKNLRLLRKQELNAKICFEFLRKLLEQGSALVRELCRFAEGACCDLDLSLVIFACLDGALSSSFVSRFFES